MQQQQSTNIQPIQAIDYRSALELSKTKDVLDHFFLSLCGLQIIRAGDKATVSRLTKPAFTYEYAQQLITEIHIQANRITARTHFDSDYLERFYLLACDTLSDSLARVGFHHLISYEAWKQIQLLTGKDKDGKSGWERAIGLDWQIDEPVTYEMLAYVKKTYGLEEESWNQSAVLRSIFLDVHQFIVGATNRSKEHLTLDHEKAIHRETTTLLQDKPQQNEGWVDSVRKAMNKLAGGGRY